MLFDYKNIKVFVFQELIDMRLGFERLSYLVREKLSASLNDGHIYLFFGKNRRRIKALYFDGSGLVLVHKRMEKNFLVSAQSLSEIKEVSIADLKLLFHGSLIRRPLIERQKPMTPRESVYLPKGNVASSGYANP